MIFIASNEAETSSTIENFLRLKGHNVKVAKLEDFSKGLKGNINLVIYDTNELEERDVVNIALAKKKNIPLVLVIPYLPEESLDEVSRLWRDGYLKGCLLKPINMDDLLKSLPQAKPLVGSGYESTVSKGGDEFY